VNYDLAELADQVQSIVGDAEAQLRLEQAVYGLDSMDELAIHALIGGGLAAHYSVASEVHYPSSAGSTASHRLRCDLVLTPPGRPLRRDTRTATLFDPVDPCPPGQALWLEIKVAHQFGEGGIPHGGYGGQWRTGVVEDLRKMAGDPRIREAALLLVVFTESLAIVEKDLELFERTLVRKEVVAGFRRVRNVNIQDRLGHRVCTVAVWPTVQ
jgi:hypothetical protein